MSRCTQTFACIYDCIQTTYLQAIRVTLYTTVSELRTVSKLSGEPQFIMDSVRISSMFKSLFRCRVDLKVRYRITSWLVLICRLDLAFCFVKISKFKV